MNTLTKLCTLALFAGAALSTAIPSTAQTPVMTPSPDIYVVMFRADWCAPCKVVEPKIDTALDRLSDPGIEYVTIDISDPSLSEISAHRAFDRDIVTQYNHWLGITGFAAIIDASTKSTLGCVNMLYDADSMVTHIGNLKTHAVADSRVFDITCPDGNGVG